MPKPIDITGQTYGRLTVVSLHSRKTSPSGKTVRMWLCQCSCGAQPVINQQSLTGGQTQSCGCLNRERVAAASSRRIGLRGDAKLRGDLHYFTGEPCPHGHIAARFVSSGRCVACAAAQISPMTEKRREMFRRSSARYYRRHPERLKAAAANRRARKFNIPGILTGNHIRLIFRRQRDACAQCLKELGTNYVLDHKVALSFGGPNHPTNIQLLCPDCDLIKRASENTIQAITKRIPR